MSGKFQLTARMLDVLRKRTKDRIVIVSCYTQVRAYDAHKIAAIE